MQNNKITGLPMEEYRRRSGLSKHELDNFAIAPSYYKYRKGQEWNPSREMILGTLVHSLALEGRTDFAIAPECDRRTKEGKATWQAFCEDNIGMEILTVDEGARVQAAARNAMDLLGKAQVDEVEASMFWERSGVQCKGRPDVLGSIKGRPVIIDLKTTSDIARFDSKFFSFRYDVQAEWYQYGWRKLSGKDCEFWFLVVDMQPPHLCQFVLCGSDVLETASERIENDLDVYKVCLEHDNWPGLPETRIITRYM